MKYRRAHFLRGYGARPFAHSIPSPADDCSKCRGGKYPCMTPDACGLREAPVQVVKSPLFADSPYASAAIGIALVLAVVFVLWLVGSGQ